jgi:hypothetical protein
VSYQSWKTPHRAATAGTGKPGAINNELNPVYTHYSHGFPTHLRIDALFLGVALAYVYHFHGDKFRGVARWR